jgi:DNA mismatch repair protein MutS
VKNFHIAVKEVGKNVIFLRKLKEGGVAHSFGLHVARMAGMPRQVLESAEKTLAALEAGDSGKILRCAQNDIVQFQGSTHCHPDATHCHPERSEGSLTKKKNTIKPHNIKEGRVESDGSIQLSFFQLEDPLLSSLKDELDKADLNNMTPLQAFDLLRSMKEQLGI